MDKKQIRKFQRLTDEDLQFPPEVFEIADFLAKTDMEYAIFAGFATYLLVGVPTSPDVDIFVTTRAQCLALQKEFELKGWSFGKLEEECSTHYNIVVNKNGCEFDFTCSDTVNLSLLPHIVEVPFGPNQQVLKVLSPEALLLTKINQVTHPKRSPAKRERDLVGIERLRPMVSSSLMSQISSVLEGRYWNDGRL